MYLKSIKQLFVDFGWTHTENNENFKDEYGKDFHHFRKETANPQGVTLILSKGHVILLINNESFVIESLLWLSETLKSMESK